jgi:hypothetical protein
MDRRLKTIAHVFENALIERGLVTLAFPLLLALAALLAR